MDRQLINVALSDYQPRDYSEKLQGDYVNYGEDNLYPQHLVDLYHTSPTHRALCTTIAQMIYGDGFVPTDQESRLLYEKWNLEDELRKVALDLKLQGGFAIEVNWSLDRSTIADVRHLPFENIRCGEMDEDEVVQTFYYSPNWADRQTEPTALARFDAKTKIEHPVQVLYVKPFSPGSAYYPKPDYIGCLPYIELEPEIGRFHINNIQNGLMTSMAVHFANGIPEEEEQVAIKNQIKREASGAGNAGNFWVTFSDSPDKRPAIDTFQLSDADKQYEFLSRECVDKIMIGHRVVSPAMFGVKTAGQLGNQQELEAASDLFQDQVLEPMQRVIRQAIQPFYVESGTMVSYQVEEAAVDVVQEFTGIQISSAIDVISKTKTGELGESQAAQILRFMLGFSADAVAELFPNLGQAENSPNAALKSAEAPRVPDGVFEFLQGEEIGEEWTLIDSRPVDYEREAEMDALWEFARVVPTTGAVNSDQDTDIVRVRYAYAPTTLLDDKNRDFCRLMLNAGKVYRKEDIVSASGMDVNPGWGPRGANTYDIWRFKGGGSCRHFWERRTYIRTTNARISVADAQRIIRRAGVDAERLPANEPDVAKRPRDMKNRGFLDPRKFTTPR